MKYYKTDNRADYCEMFEAVEEFSKEKIPRGTTVVLVGDKIRPAKEGETPFGVISSFPIMVGNSGGTDAGSCWGEKYLKDEFGNFVWEKELVWELKKEDIENTEVFKDDLSKKHKVTGFAKDGIPFGARVKEKLVRKMNPEYDSSVQYIPRVKRNEWNMVGLIGKLKILKGQPVAQNWIKMKEISENVDEWLVR